MYWIVLCALVASVSGTRRGVPLLYEDFYNGDSGEADSITYHRDDNAHMDIKSDQNLNQYVSFVHKKEHGFTKEYLSNKTSDDMLRTHSLRTAHKRRCEMSVTSIIEKENYCQLCTCYLGQWVCMFATSCYYKYDFSNQLCKNPKTRNTQVYFDGGCYVCSCEQQTDLMHCVKNPAAEDQERCHTSKNLDVFRGE